MGWASIESAARGRTEHSPTSDSYPDTVVRRTSFTAGGGLGWRISALETPRETPAPWKIVVITGAPSWAEYWAETLAGLPQDREMIVVDRPGYGASEPQEPVRDIRVQAQALSPLLQAARGQKIILVGQDMATAIAALMAEAHPGKVESLVLLSGFFSGSLAPRRGNCWTVVAKADLAGPALYDLRQRWSNAPATTAATRLRPARRPAPPLDPRSDMIHGDKDDFAPIEVAERAWPPSSPPAGRSTSLRSPAGQPLPERPAPGRAADRRHLEACIPARLALGTFRWPKLPAINLPGVSWRRRAARCGLSLDRRLRQQAEDRRRAQHHLSQGGSLATDRKTKKPRPPAASRWSLRIAVISTGFHSAAASTPTTTAFSPAIAARAFGWPFSRSHSSSTPRTRSRPGRMIAVSATSHAPPAARRDLLRRAHEAGEAEQRAGQGLRRCHSRPGSRPGSASPGPPRQLCSISGSTTWPPPNTRAAPAR